MNFKIINVQAKDIYATIEMSLTDIKRIIDFSEKSLPLYQKVYDEEAGDIRDEFIKNLKDLVRTIENGPGSNSQTI